MPSFPHVGSFTRNLAVVVVVLLTLCPGYYGFLLHPYWPFENGSKTPKPVIKRPCAFHWTLASNACYRAFDTTLKLNFAKARNHCKLQGATLVSKQDVMAAKRITDKAFWVERDDNSSTCQVNKRKQKMLHSLDCSVKRHYICKTSAQETDIAIEYFGLAREDKAITQGETGTLQCRLSGWTSKKPNIRIGHRTDQGFFAVLKEGGTLKLEYHGEMQCEDTGRYWCEVDSEKGIQKSAMVLVAEKCPPIWCEVSDSPNHSRLELKMGESFSLHACFYNAHQLTINSSTVEWYKDNMPYIGQDQPALSITNSSTNEYSLTVEVSRIVPEHYGMWSLRLVSFYDGIPYPSKPFHFTIGWLGPPVFCPDQAVQDTVHVGIGKSHVTNVCILSPLRPSSVTSQSPPGKRTATSVSADIQDSASLPGLGFILHITVGALTEDDLGDWTFVTHIERFSLNYSLTINAEGPIQFCPAGVKTKSKKNNDFTVALFEPLQFSVCFLSPSGALPPGPIKLFQDSSEHLRESDTFKTRVAKMDGYKLRYNVEISADTIKPKDLGPWKLVVFKEASYQFDVQAQGPPQCPLDVNVTGQTSRAVTLSWLPGHNGGDSQTFIVFYGYVNGDSDGSRKWYSRHFPMTKNGRDVSGTVGSLPANTSFKFRVAGVNKFNTGTVTSSTCDGITVEATTDVLGPDDRVQGTNPQRTISSSDDGWFDIHTLYIVIGVALLAGFIIVVSVLGVFIYRRRGPPKHRHRKLLENVGTEDDSTYVNAQTFRTASSSVEKQYTEEGEEERTNQSLINNPTYQNSSSVETELFPQDNGRHVTDEGLVYVSIDHSATRGKKGGNATYTRSSASQSPILQTFAPRPASTQNEHISEEKTEYANVEFSKAENCPKDETEVNTLA